MKRSGIITLQFYRLLLIYNVTFTLLPMSLVLLNSGSINTGVFIYSKIVGFMAGVGLHYFSEKKTYFYFRNSGYRVTRIITSAFVIDLSICAIIITVSKLLLYAAAHIKG
ncbi:hypothetical protein SAMN05216464_10523 [Mucilaginibacter pineti]|uniref:Uncharacterized protein n=1 Tax=Mucilaginibacter pineti TaxID=1391627 RepID=A0A1G7BIV0_9SPHI|nr:hypothetical protein [Mucilaginibacter pineti]SDE26376.1 hypothetical protein SAMN05216464_10523 [Mucilaginibacter pineti]